jgi:RNA polymerase sigma-70 factor (ECF subfamily)
MVWRTVSRLLRGDGDRDAEDCFQEVFMAALEVGRREEVRNWEALLRRIATSKALDALRARIRRRARDGDRVVAWETLAGGGAAPDRGLQQEELAADLREALAALRAEEAELFCLRHLEEMSYEEIAMQRGMTAGAVGVALHRVKEKLRGLLERGKVSIEREVRDE